MPSTVTAARPRRARAARRTWGFATALVLFGIGLLVATCDAVPNSRRRRRVSGRVASPGTAPDGLRRTGSPAAAAHVPVQITGELVLWGATAGLLVLLTLLMLAAWQ